ncbi:MAG: cytochrome P450 [Rhodospirillales bacterium]
MNDIVQPGTLKTDETATSARSSQPRAIPRVSHHPLVGVLPEMRRDPLKFAVETAAKEGGIAELDLGLERILLVTEPDYIKHVIQDNAAQYHKSKFVRMLRPMVGNGIMLAEDDRWLFQRRATAKGFQGLKMKAMVDGMTAAGDDLIARWSQAQVEGQAIDIAPEMMRVTFDVILRGLYNYTLKDEYQEVYGALSLMLRETEKRIWSYVPLPDWLPTPSNRRFDAGQKVLHAFIDRIIAERRATADAEPDFLSLLIAAYGDEEGRSLPAHLIRDEALAFALAGHDTTANALAWTFVLLSKHPEIWARLKGEVDQVLEGRRPGFDDINNLVYTKMVIEEAMRLYPPVWTFSRTALKADRLGDFAVKPGDHLMMPPWAVHRRPDLWPNPEGFDPERFRPEVARNRDRYHYIPFGAGPRVCLGARFSVMEAIVLLAMVTQRFRLALEPGQTIIEPEPMITLRPKGRVAMTLQSV